jgi:hypothetical protein
MWPYILNLAVPGCLPRIPAKVYIPIFMALPTHLQPDQTFVAHTFEYFNGGFYPSIAKTKLMWHIYSETLPFLAVFQETLPRFVSLFYGVAYPSVA